MFLDILHSTLEVPKAFRQVVISELFDQALGVLVKVQREPHWLVEDLLEELHRVLVCEGANACDHLVNQDAEAVPVDSLAVAFAQYNFGRDVLGCAAEGDGPRAWLEILAEPEVRDLEVTIRLQ